MAKPLQPGFVYLDSVILKQRIALHEKSGWVFCEDKYPNGELVTYSPKELKVIYETGEPISPDVHIVKKIFTGEIVGYDRRSEIEGTGKSDAGRIEDHSADHTNPGGEIPGASGNVPANREGELDIY
jgi:hypothetical protein